MCTYSLIRFASNGFRLSFNRDEQRTRPQALPPSIYTFGERKAIMPRDPIANGTWIGVNDAGLAMTILNVYPVDAAKMRPMQGHRRSRGLVIPYLMHCRTAEEADGMASKLRLHQYPPFTLICVDPHQQISRRWDGDRLTRIAASLNEAPFLFVSSGLGDACVDPPRRDLFTSMLVADPTPATQTVFHRHVWPDRPEVSVCMSRSDACTISYTDVEVTASRVVLRYFGAPPDQPVAPVRLELQRIPTAA